jgi:two-component system LytT family response regulator
MIKTIIVDDENNASEFLEKMLHRYFPNKFYVCGLFETVVLFAMVLGKKVINI